MNIKQVILFLIVSLLSISFVSAYGFDIEYTALNNEIFLNEGAVFEVTIVNNLATANRYRISVGDFTEWSVETNPQSYKLSGVLVNPKESKTFKLILYPKNIRPGQKSIKVIAKSEDTKEEIRKYIKINLKSEYTIPSYSPDIKLKIYLPDEGKIDPRETAVFRVELKNRNLIELKDIELILRSNLIEAKDTGINLTPLQKKVVDFNVNFNPAELPKKDTLVATAIVNNKSFVSIEEFNIEPYYENFVKKEEIKKKILKRIKEISVINTGNAEHEETIKTETTFLRSIFSHTEPRAGITEEDNKRYFTWTLSIAPQETETIQVILNFRPLFTVLLIIAVAVLLYYYMRSPVLLKISYSNVSMKHGGVSSLKIILNVINRGKKELSNVVIIDNLPSIVELEKEFKVGSLHPTKVLKHEKRGTILKWEIESLEPGEEVVITYSIKSKLSILGTFTIPPAVARYKTEQGIKSRARSNGLNVSPVD